jgi:hypothetical protein
MSNEWRHAGRAALGCLALAALAAGCGGSQPAGSALTAAQRHRLAKEYLAVALPANGQLDHEVDGYGDAEKDDDLAAARTDLAGEVATERAFDAAVLRIRFPASIEGPVRALVRANGARIALTLRQEGAGSVAVMRALDRRHKAADAAVEAPVRVIRADLGLPPPDTD